MRSTHKARARRGPSDLFCTLVAGLSAFVGFAYAGFLGAEKGQEPLSFMLARPLLLTHPFQFFADFTRIFILPLKGDK